MEINASKPVVFTLMLTLVLGGFVFALKPFDHSHSLLRQVLTEFVKAGRVDYKKLKAKPENLNSYLSQLASTSESEFNQWKENERLAYLINLYNATTLKLIINHYPVGSIKDIGNILKGPWDQPIVVLFGKTITLNELEHGIIRKQYHEPRVHFALVCAAKGCPPLRGEPYVAQKLSEQLDDQGRIFLNTLNKNWIDLSSHTIYLSLIFKWFKHDFEKKSDSVLNCVRVYFPPEIQKSLEGTNWKIKYTDYDWSLNDLESSK